MFRIPYAPPEGYLENEYGDEETTEEDNNENVQSLKSGEDTTCSQERKAQWLASSWKLDAFNEKLPPSERKAEWRKFRDQFQRICDCKIEVDPITKLKGMKIHAGEYLLNIIEMQHSSLGTVEDVFTETIRLVDRYFDSTCNKTQERMKFRQMKQKSDENFTDWVLRLESQSKFCDFQEEQRKEEFLQALIESSIPELAEKLYEASSFFDNDITKMIQHGQHLDVVRMKKVNNIVTTAVKTESNEDSTRPIMWVGDKGTFKNRNENRYEPYNKSSGDKRGNDYKPRNWVPSKECDQCARRHMPNRCPAYRSKCGKCGMIGHWAEKCRSNPRNRRWEKDNKEDVFKHVARINKGR